MPGIQNEWYAREKNVRNMPGLTPQFKIKHGLEQGDFVRVAFANFFK